MRRVVYLTFAVLFSLWIQAQTTPVVESDNGEQQELGLTNLFRQYPEFRRGIDPYANLSGTLQENVDTYSGKLTIRFPLPSIPWSATTSFCLPLTYSSNVWSFSELGRPRARGGELDLSAASFVKGSTTDIVARPDFFDNDSFTRFSLTGNPHSLPGWTLAVGGVYTEFVAGTNPIGLAGQYTSECYRTRMEKKYFVSPDGSTHLLVDTKTGNRPYWGLQSSPTGDDENLLTTPTCTFSCKVAGNATNQKTLYSPAREAGALGQRQWHSVDGSFFLYDEASHAVYGPDGVVYSLNDKGVICSIADAEGNTINFRIENDPAKNLKYLEYSNKNQTGVRIYFEERILAHYANQFYSPIKIMVPVMLVSPGMNGPVTYRFETQDLVTHACTAGVKKILMEDLFYSCKMGFSDIGKDEAFSKDPPVLTTGSSGANHQVTVLTGLVLPDGRAFRFRYSTTGRLVQITYPDGGSRRYEYGDTSPNSFIVKGGVSEGLWKAKRVGDSAWGGVCLIWQNDGSGNSRVEKAFCYSGYSGSETQPVHSLEVSLDGGVVECDYPGVVDDNENSILQFGLTDWRLGKLQAERNYSGAPGQSWTEDRLNAFRGRSNGSVYSQNYADVRNRELGSSAPLIRETVNEWNNYGDGWYWTAPSSYQCNNGDGNLAGYYSYHGQVRPEWNPVIKKQVSRVWEGGSTCVEQVTDRIFDDIQGPSGEKEYRASLKEETVSGGGTSCRTSFQYRHYWPDLASTSVKRRMLNLPLETTVSSPSDQKLSSLCMEYDWSVPNQVSSLASLRPRTRKQWIEGTRYAVENYEYESSGDAVRLHASHLMDKSQCVLTTTLGYDSAGFCNLVISTPSNQGSPIWQMYVYHPETGLLLRRGDANGDLNGDRIIQDGEYFVEYGYDSFNRPVSTTQHGPAGETINGENQGSLRLSETRYAPLGGRYWSQSRTWLDGAKSQISRVENDAFGRPAFHWVTLGEENGQLGVSFTQRTFTESGQVETETLPAKALASLSDLTSSSPSWPRPQSSGTVTHRYDAMSREIETVTATTDGAGTATSSVSYGVAFNGANYCQLQTVTDEAGNWRQLFLDALGRTVQVSEPSDSGGTPWKTSYEYDPSGHLTRVRKLDRNGQNGQVRDFSYDGLGKVIRATFPELAGKSFTFRYDDRGNLEERYLCTGNGPAEDFRETWEYDSWSRPVSRQVFRGNSLFGADGMTLQTIYDYDVYGSLPTGFSGGNFALGRLVRDSTTSGVAGSPTATVSRHFAYNWRGEVRQKTEELDSAGIYHTLFPDYDRAGNLRRMVYPSGEEVSLTYGQGGGMNSIRLGTDSLFRDITYSANGSPVSQKLPGGVNWAEQYNSRGWPVALRVGNGVTFQTPVSDPSLLFGLDFSQRLSNGNLTGQVRTARLRAGDAPRTLSGSWEYDSLGRLRVFNFTEGSRSGRYRYDMDEFGNLLAEVAEASSGDVPEGRTLSLDRGTNRLQSTSAYNVAYDALGNQIRFPDDQGFSLNGTYLDQGHLGKIEKGNTIWRYYLDADGRRRIVARGATGLSDVRLSFFQGVALIAELYRGGLETTDTSQDGYLINDHLGTTRAVLDPSSGSLSGIIDAMPYGEPIAASPSSVPSPFFTGRPRDVESGLDQAPARPYSYQFGRWLRPDLLFIQLGHVTNPQGWNLFGYLGGDPVNCVDPMGLAKEETVYIGDLGSAEVTASPEEAPGIALKSWFPSRQLGGNGGGSLYDGLFRMVKAHGWENPGGQYNFHGPQMMNFIIGFYLSEAAGATVGAGIECGLISWEIRMINREVQAIRAMSAWGNLSMARHYGLKPYTMLRKALKGTGLQAHHLLEARFEEILGQKASQMLSVAVTKSEHQVFTNAWRRLIPYGAGTEGATKKSIMEAARKIYADHPVILRMLGL